MQDPVGQLWRPGVKCQVPQGAWHFYFIRQGKLKN